MVSVSIHVNQRLPVDVTVKPTYKYIQYECERLIKMTWLTIYIRILNSIHYFESNFI